LKQSIASLRKNIVEAGKRAYARGYVAAYDGNISVRVDAKRILITPSGVSKGYMKAGGLVLVDMNGRIISGTKKPSSELLMHLQIYKERNDIQSVCHLHPPYATGFAAAGIQLDRFILTEAEMALGEIPLIDYAPPGTEEFANKIIPYLKDSKAFLLTNHGALTVGFDIFDAYYNMETLEHTAHILFIARQLGHLRTLNAEQIKELDVLREKYKRQIR
jgi:L-fuculose-phosphate aldolase